MGALILPSRFAQQPQQPAPIDRSNPLGAKVVESVSFSGNPLTSVSDASITYGASGSIVATTKGRSLRGQGASGARASIPLDLSKYNVITLAFWLYWDGYANDDAFAMEFTANTNNTAGAFYVDPNSGAGGGKFAIVPNGSGANGNGMLFDRPSAAAWHRYCASIDIRTQAITLAVDGGVVAGVSANSPATTGTTFANSTLNLLSRAGSGLFGTGNLQDLIVYAGALSPNEMAQDYANPYQIFKAPARRFWVAAAASPIIISPTPAGVAASGSAVTVSQPHGVLPAAATVSATSPNPSLAQGRSVTPGVATLSITSTGGAVAQPRFISPDTAQVAASGLQPSADQPRSLSVDPAAVSAITLAPSIAQLISVSPLPASIVTISVAPSIARAQFVAPSAGTVAASGNIPTIAQLISVSPFPALVTTVASAPAINQGFSVAPGAAAIVVTGPSPIVVQPSGVSPAPAQVAAASSTPTLIRGQSVSPGTAAISAIGSIPNISGTALISPAACTIFVTGPAPSITQPIVSIPTRSIDIKQDHLLTAIRSFVLSLVTQPVLRTPVNRAVMPVGSFIAMSPGTVKALATNTHGPQINGTRSVKRSSQFDCQIDCYGVDAGDTAAMLSMMFRDQYAIEQFELQPFEIVPLYADDAHQMPVVTGEEQYLERWTFDIAVQFNPVVSMPAQSATMLELSLRNVDRTYPP